MEEKILNEEMFVETVCDNAELVAEGTPKTEVEVSGAKAALIAVGVLAVGTAAGKLLAKGIEAGCKGAKKLLGKAKAKLNKKMKDEKGELKYEETDDVDNLMDDLRTDDED